MIEVCVRHKQGDFKIEADFHVGAGVTALFGPSGSGKTSLVQMIAGLSRPDAALIRFGDTLWNDTKRGIFMPPHRRRIGYVFQEGRLFPHLTTRQNLLYGQFFSPRSDRRIAEDEVVDLLGLRRLLGQRPRTLSGGEKQRVAIGRALLSAPRLILMDEPLSALDRARRQEILPYIERIRDVFQLPVIYVSHALEEVARLATRVVLLEEGRIVRQGAPVDVFPEIQLSDSLMPQSILQGRILGHAPHYGLSMAAVGDATVTLQPVDLPEGTPVRLRLAATDVMLALRPVQDISALNSLPGTIISLAVEGPYMLVTIDCYGQRLVARVTLLSAERLALRRGLAVHALFKAVTVDSASVYHVMRSGEDSPLADGIA